VQTIQANRIPSRPSPAPLQKYCATCDTVKDSTAFHANRAKGDGLASQCKSCKAAYDRARTTVAARRYAANVRRDIAAQERVERLVAAVLELSGLTEAELVAPGVAPAAAHARHLIAWVGVRSRLAPTRIIGNRLNRKRMAISRGVERIDVLRERVPELRSLTDSLRRQFQQ
jgi:hypothetical protein